MDDAEDQDKRAELLSRMFALLTAKCEDAATIAVECQARLTADLLREGAAELEDVLGEAATLAAAVSALLHDQQSDGKTAYDE
jgi:hypothetical protein